MFFGHSFPLQNHNSQLWNMHLNQEPVNNLLNQAVLTQVIKIIKRKKNLDSVSCFFLLQKADGTCNTNFKKTKHREQVMQALKDFVDGNTQILVCEVIFIYRLSVRYIFKPVLTISLCTVLTFCCLFFFLRNSTCSSWRTSAQSSSSRTSSRHTR